MAKTAMATPSQASTATDSPDSSPRVIASAMAGSKVVALCAIAFGVPIKTTGEIAPSKTRPATPAPGVWVNSTTSWRLAPLASA